MHALPYSPCMLHLPAYNYLAAYMHGAQYNPYFFQLPIRDLVTELFIGETILSLNY